MVTDKYQKMITIDSRRNFAARMKEIRDSAQMTQKQFAKSIGVTQAQISAYEQGKGIPSRSTFLNICQQFRINEQWLTEGVQTKSWEPISPDYIRVVGRVGVSLLDFSADNSQVERPPDVPEAGSIAVEMKGDGLSPRYDPGDILICSSSKPCRSGDYCVVKTTDGEYAVGKLDVRLTRYVLHNLSQRYPAQNIDNDSLAAIHKIVWKKEGQGS